MQLGLVPNGEGESVGITMEMTSVDLTKALCDWDRHRGQLDAGEMTLDEYRHWKVLSARVCVAPCPR